MIGLIVRAPGRVTRRRSRGQSLVEFALVFPIIVLLVMAFMEIGRAVFAYNTIANAARQGARVAAVNQLADVTECDESRPIEDPYEPHWSMRGCAILAAKTLGILKPNAAVAESPLRLGEILAGRSVVEVNVLAAWKAKLHLAH